MFTLTLITLQAESQPRTWTVDDDGTADFRTIKEAINAASEGDFIRVYSGIYYEHLVLSKPLTLVGESKESTIIDGRAETQNVILITANNVSISGFTVQNSSLAFGTSYAGIKISGRLSCNITDNYITRNKIGILITSQKSSVAKNIIANNGQGIALYDSSQVTVEANNITKNTVGISLALSFNNTIVGNSITNSSTGGHGITLASNSFNNTILRNELMFNYHGMWLSSSSKNLIAENTIADNKLLGVELASSPNNIFYHNNFINNPTSVRIDNKSSSVWDDGYPSGGNYWDKYVDFDEKSGPNQEQSGSDGIWDNPYVIDVNNQDRYPFVIPYGEIPDAVKDKTKPNADAGPDRTVTIGTPVTFDGSQSTDNVAIISYEWNFGDGTTKTGKSPTHTYSGTGIYTVTLTVKDAAGNFDSDSMIVTVEVPPIYSFSWFNWVLPAIIGTAIALVLLGRSREYRHRRRSSRKISKSITSKLCHCSEWC